MIGLRKARKARNWNQQKVAMDLNITRREPSLAMLERMSDYFDVSIHYLITGREFEKRTETVYPK